MNVSVLQVKSLFKMLELSLTSELDWGFYMISIAATVSKKILIRSMKFLSSEVALCLYKSTIWSCMECCCHVWAGATSGYLDMLDKLQKLVSRTVFLSVSLKSLAHCRNVAKLSLYYGYNFGRCSSKLAELVPLPYSSERSPHYSNTLHCFSVTIPRCYQDVYVNSFSSLWNSLPPERFPLTYNLKGLKSKVNRQIYIWVLPKLLFYMIFIFFL